MFWHLDPQGNLAHYATTWPNLEEFFPAHQNCFTAGLVLQSPSCCLCCPSDHRTFVCLSLCHKPRVRGGGWLKNQSLPRAATLQKPCWQYSDHPNSASQLVMPWKHLILQFECLFITPVANTSSSINSTGLTAETLLSASPSQHMQWPFLKKRSREVLKGHMWTVSSR